MRPLLATLACCACLAGSVAGAPTGPDRVEVEVVAGYSFLFAERGGGFARNHADVSEGALVDEFHLVFQPGGGDGWCDRLEVNASLAHRVDQTKSVRLGLTRYARYAVDVRYDFQYDHFRDGRYNDGGNDRRLSRQRFQFDFRYLGLGPVEIQAGYGLLDTGGPDTRPESHWGDEYRLPLDRNLRQEEFRAGLTYRRGGFSAGVERAWLDVTDRLRLDPARLPDWGPMDRDIALVEGSDQGRYRATIPSSTGLVAFAAERWSADARFTRRDGRLDLDHLDVRTFLFEAYPSVADTVARVLGRGEAPEDLAEGRLEVRPTDAVQVGYRFGWHRLVVGNDADITDTLRLGTHLPQPVIVSRRLIDRYEYHNRRQEHEIDLRLYPTRRWTLGASARWVGGRLWDRLTRDVGLVSALESAYSYRTVAGEMRYRARCGTDIRGHFARTAIDDPAFRTAGRTRDDGRLTLRQRLGDGVSLQLNGRLAETRDRRADHTDRVCLVDVAAQWSPGRSPVDLEAGYTWVDLDVRSGFTLPLDRSRVLRRESYDAGQHGVHVAVGLRPVGRVSGRVSVHYLDDTGRSFPLSRWSGRLDLETVLGRGVSALLSGRLWEYTENLWPGREYRVNQLVLALKWTHR